jgi:carbamate kinase
MGIAKGVVTVVTQVEVDPADPAFANPSKPIGSFFSEPDAIRRRDEEGWDIAEDSNRGWRRVVASPIPKRIVEVDAIKTLIDAGLVVIAAGGGGIPVVADDSGALHGVAAVIDKDRASAMLATEIGADLLLISTSVEKVALDFGTPEQRWVSELSLEEAKTRLEEGTHFLKGSMAPKIEAVIDFLEAGGDEAIITNPENLERAMQGATGTRIHR